MTAEKTSTSKSEPLKTPQDFLEGEWSIRQCFLYKDEYDDCRSFKARFHQYFVHGENTDCSQWKIDYDNCCQFREKKDIEAGKAVIQSEAERRRVRMQAHYANDVWKKRKAPPEDWSKPLPEWLQKKNEGTFLAIKAQELKTGIVSEPEKKSYCSIM
ncbi:unnamed protein product [Hermetia illucens]|uniref:Synaptic plasticity regulator PANTS n=1 Tax=Hermetia illucens TaxID=343691 RepID=A0A7R8YL32_HERIL|nr:UPF0545 protein C22orf39 homolog [Hermetia illucens]CAD7077073.1 unnamed protein product [Hermetia illucens]